MRFGSRRNERYYRGRANSEPRINVRGAPKLRTRALERLCDTARAADRISTDSIAAKTIEDALAALRTYPGPTQNFVIADTSGRVAYQLAGADSERSALVARHSPGIRPRQDVSCGAVRTAAPRRRVARRNRMDFE